MGAMPSLEQLIWETHVNLARKYLSLRQNNAKATLVKIVAAICDTPFHSACKTHLMVNLPSDWVRLTLLAYARIL